MAAAPGLKPFVLPLSLRIIILDTSKLVEYVLSALLEPLARSETRAVVVSFDTEWNVSRAMLWDARSSSSHPMLILELFYIISVCYHTAFCVVLALTSTTGPQAQGPPTGAPPLFHVRPRVQGRP